MEGLLGVIFYMEVLLKYLFCGNFTGVFILWKFYWSIYFVEILLVL